MKCKRGLIEGIYYFIGLKMGHKVVYIGYDNAVENKKPLETLVCNESSATLDLMAPHMPQHNGVIIAWQS